MNEPVVLVGGFLSQPGDYNRWKEMLEKPPFNRKTFIVNVGRLQWATTSDANFAAQIRGLEEAVEKARRTTGAEKIWLVCHSAGGRVGRLWMGDLPYAGFKCGGHKITMGYVALGSSYTSEEPWALRSTAFANNNYPGAFYEDIPYISVIGKSVFGRRNGTITERFAHNSYNIQEKGKGEQWGDGMITVKGAYIPGAENHILDGIYHVGLFGRPDYFATQALKQWARPLLGERVAAG